VRIIKTINGCIHQLSFLLVKPNLWSGRAILRSAIGNISSNQEGNLIPIAIGRNFQGEQWSITNLLPDVDISKRKSFLFSFFMQKSIP
jgi:hypothetical protein